MIASTAKRPSVTPPHQRRPLTASAASAASRPPTTSSAISTFVVDPSARPPPARRPTAVKAIASATPNSVSPRGRRDARGGPAALRTPGSGGTATEDKTSRSEAGGPEAGEDQEGQDREHGRRQVAHAAGLRPAELARVDRAPVELDGLAAGLDGLGERGALGVGRGGQRVGGRAAA